MTVEELNALVAGGESEQVEFKRTTGQRKQAAKTVCGMLNGIGGSVLFGVGNSGAVEGLQVTSRTVEDVVAELRRIEPAVLINPDIITLPSELQVISLRVRGGLPAVYVYDGRPFVRNGPTTSIMPQEEYQRRLLEQMNPSNRWEMKVADGVGIADLDHSEITRTVEEAIRRGRLEEPGTRDPTELLAGFGLLAEGRLINAGVALFVDGEKALPHYPQCLLRMARFRGTSNREFEDNRQVVGNVFQLLQAGQRFLRDHLPVAGRVVPQLFEREDDPLYPPEALREALANAFCHRDYHSVGGSVNVAVFDDRLEIASTGRLPSGLSVEDLSRPHASLPWNPLMAGVLYRRGLIEQWGRGTLRIGELTERAGLPSPEFEERGGEVVVRFFPAGYVAPRSVERSLSELQQEILAMLGRRGPTSSTVIQAELADDLSITQVRRQLQTLRTLGLVETRGWARGARWRLSGGR